MSCAAKEVSRKNARHSSYCCDLRGLCSHRAADGIAVRVGVFDPLVIDGQPDEGSVRRFGREVRDGEEVPEPGRWLPLEGVVASVIGARAAVDIESIEAVVDLIVEIANVPIVLVLRGQRRSLTDLRQGSVSSGKRTMMGWLPLTLFHLSHTSTVTVSYTCSAAAQRSSPQATDHAARTGSKQGTGSLSAWGLPRAEPATDCDALQAFGRS